jgi:hypothetical protein
VSDPCRKAGGKADLDSVDTRVKDIQPIPKEKVVRAHTDSSHYQGVCGAPVPWLGHHVLCLWVYGLDGFRPDWVVQFIFRRLPNGMHQVYECLREGGLQPLTVCARKSLGKVHHKLGCLLKCLGWPYLSRNVSTHTILQLKEDLPSAAHASSLGACSLAAPPPPS